MKSGDRILLLIGIAAALIYSGWMMLDNSDEGALLLEVVSDGQIIMVEDLPVSERTERTVTYLGTVNTIVIEGGEVRVLEANCPTQQCVRQGIISRPGQSIVCLPGRLIVRITGKNRDVDGIVK